MTSTLLIEIGTEELPPKGLLKLSKAFSDSINQQLLDLGISCGQLKSFSTPRRLALTIENIPKKIKGKVEVKRGPSIEAAFNSENEPTQAALGFARSCQSSVPELGRILTAEGDWLCFEKKTEDRPIEVILQNMIVKSLHDLPISKRMRWGDGKHEFAIQWVTVMLGSRFFNMTILGINSSNFTKGHRFHTTKNITLADADSYEKILETDGYVIPCFNKRQDKILAEIAKNSSILNGTVDVIPELLEEVTALVEWPKLVFGNFDKHFLELPEEVLISSMQKHQKYFPVRDDEGKLTNKFVTISNIESKNAAVIREGNERVIRPRLSDAKFFFEKDTATTLESNGKRLSLMLFEKRLGSLQDKTYRVRNIAIEISYLFDVPNDLVETVALLSRCDLLTEMVGEFPDLQGIIGGYYASIDGLNSEVCNALSDFYRPRFSGDNIPHTHLGQCVSLADKIDTLVGIFGLDLKPTGDKDPYALRRAALGIIRIILEAEVPIDLQVLIKLSLEKYESTELDTNTQKDLIAFMLERMRIYELSNGVPSDVYDTVQSKVLFKPLDIRKRLQAAIEFSKLESAKSLVAANKRIANILKKAPSVKDIQLDKTLLLDEAELTLATKISDLSPDLNKLYLDGKYVAYLTSLEELSGPIELFFKDVMVMSDDEAIRNNRLQLLKTVHKLFVQVVDIGHLKI
jgi:glycyl-tRNA synthetase beta chain